MCVCEQPYPARHAAPGREESPSASPSRSGRGLVSVWCTGQQVSRHQRVGRYVPESTAHPARMLPSIARHVIESYSAAGEVVLDPMCGIGTTLVEAMHLGRTGVGVEFEPRWVALAQRNLAHARSQSAYGPGFVWRGDARTPPGGVVEAVAGRVGLVLTSPPYGPSCHGQVAVHGRVGHVGSVLKTDQRYSGDRRNLAHRPARDLFDGFARVLDAVVPLLAPGGRVVVTARPWRRGGHLIDLPTVVLRAGRAAGLTPVERCVALLGRIEEVAADPVQDPGRPSRAVERLVAHGSFFQVDNARRAVRAGVPQSLITHEDVVVFVLERP